MSKLIVQNNGPLCGEVIISGAKNAVLPLMAATLLSSKTCLIDDVPDLKDVSVMKEMLMSFGAEINTDNKEALEVKVEEITTTNGDYELVKKMRASFLVVGPLLSRCGRAYMPLPGGCAIGKRPIDLHLKGFKALGAEVTEGDFFVEVKAGPEGLIGDTIYLDFPSVGATENIMMAAVLAKGTTYIENAAEEPEIVDLANFLNKMGSRIKGAGTDTIKIEGVTELRGVKHTVIPDRIETGTFMLAAAITRGEVLIKNIVPDHVKPIIAKLKECGVTVELVDEGMYVDARDRVLTATNIKTLPYPGFPTDIQSPFMAFLTTVKGTSEVTETVFENRFMHVNELNRMGANIKIEDRIAFVPGDSELEGTKVVATDLRAGAALVLAGLYAKDVTEISQIYHIERGYENFVDKFRKLGATIIKVKE